MTSVRSLRRWRLRTIVAATCFAAAAAAWVTWLWLFDAASVPAAADAVQLSALEKQAYGSLRDINRIVVVRRGEYAAASTNIDLDNYALYERAGLGWRRLTKNGWLFTPDKFAFWKAGVPFWTANALANGIRVQERKGLDLPFFDSGC